MMILVMNLFLNKITLTMNPCLNNITRVSFGFDFVYTKLFPFSVSHRTGTRKSRRLVSDSKETPEQQNTVTDEEDRVHHSQCMDTNTVRKPDPDSPHNQPSSDVDGETGSDASSQHSQSDNETPIDSNACSGPCRELKLDPDVLTMDMDSDEETKSVKDHGIKASVKPLVQKKQNQQENSSSAKGKSKETNVRKKAGEMKSSEKTKRDKHDDDVSQKNECEYPPSREDPMFHNQSDSQEQAVPSAETEFKNSEDQEQEFTLDFEMVPKPQSVISVSIVNPAVDLDEADEDSDPFEFMEE
jgi:hypothetical protein